MSNSTLAASNKQSGTGTWDASIPGYRDQTFQCKPDEFVTNGKEVYLRVSGVSGVTSRVEFLFRFSAAIAAQTYFFGQAGSPKVPELSLVQGGNITVYVSKKDQGQITVKSFDLGAGTLEATINFTLTDHTSDNIHQAACEIKLAGLVTVP